MPTQRGFTLIELLVTLTVLAIVVGIGVPGLRDFTLNNRRVAAVNEVIASLALARSESIARNVTVSMCPSEDGAGCSAAAWSAGWIIFSDADGNGAPNDDDVIIRAVEEVDGLSVTSPELAAGLTYRPNGRIRNRGQLVFCDPRGAEHARVVQLDMVGRPIVAKSLINGVPPAC